MTKLELETVVDKLGIDVLLHMLSEIANEKAAHVESAWQDVSRAQAWRYLSGRLSGLVRQCVGL